MTDSKLREALEKVSAEPHADTCDVRVLPNDNLDCICHVGIARAALSEAGERCPNPECGDPLPGWVPAAKNSAGSVGLKPRPDCNGTGKRDAPDHTAPLIDGDYEGDGVPVSIDDHEIAAAIERAKKSGAEAVGLEEAWEAYKRQQPIMYGGEREAFYAAWQASQTRDGWRDAASVPKDGTTIIGAFDNAAGIHTVYFDDGSWMVDDNKHGPFPLRRWMNLLAWQPLPTPPQPAQEEER